jgi:hypothetical protein
MRKYMPATAMILICFLAFIESSSSASKLFETKILSKKLCGADLPYRGVRPMGMGNIFAATSDDLDAFYYNPAGIAAVRKLRIDLQPIRFIPTQDFYDELRELDQLVDDIEAINESQYPLEDPDLEDERRRLTQRMERLMNDDLGLDVASPLRFVVPLHVRDYAVAIGGIAHAWSASQLYVQRRGLDWNDFVKDMLDDDLIYDIMAEVSYGGAAAIEVPATTLPLEISFGLAARRIHRWQMTDKDDPLGIEELINPYGKDGIEGTDDDFKERYFDPEDPLDSVSEARGYSIDAGTIAWFREIASLGLAFQNVFGEIGDEKLSRNLDVSTALNLARLGSQGLQNLDIILAASSNNETWGSGNIVDRARFGIEVVWSLPSLAISGRAGSNYGYMTLGAGIQLAFLDFDYAFYSDKDADWHAFALNLAF